MNISPKPNVFFDTDLELSFSPSFALWEINMVLISNCPSLNRSLYWPFFKSTHPPPSSLSVKRNPVIVRGEVTTSFYLLSLQFDNPGLIPSDRIEDLFAFGWQASFSNPNSVCSGALWVPQQYFWMCLLLSLNKKRKRHVYLRWGYVGNAGG